MSKAYYNENDPRAAEWLRNLILLGEIAYGDVDERSIEDVRPSDLRGYAQCHFFAGIGGWSLALKLAGWPDERPAWTGSCPCQPFSVAGKGKGTADSRHLWPAFWWLIGERKPAVVFGEQVASKAGRAWLAGVQADLEALGYRVGAADLCAAGVGAPHIRQRLWWVADTDGRVSSSQREQRSGQHRFEPEDSSACFGMEFTKGDGRIERRAESSGRCVISGCGAGGMGDTDDEGSQRRRVLPKRTYERSAWSSSLDRWLPCADGKARRIESSIEPLAHGIQGRVGLLRGYGNAIVPQVGATFVEAYLDTLLL